MDVTNETLEKLERLAHYCQEIAEDDCSEKQCARALEPLNAACSPSTILSLCAEMKRLRRALEQCKVEYWKRCSTGSGRITSLTVSEFDAFIDAALKGET